MKIELPAGLSFPVKTIDGKERVPEPVPLGFTGHITVPDKWTLGDYEAYHAATSADDKGPDDNVWKRLWVWSSDRIIDWAIDGLPTNPKHIAEHLTWVLESFLANAVIVSMDAYANDDEAILGLKESIAFPKPQDLRPEEFMAYHKAQEELSGEKGKGKSNLLKSFLVGKLLVREWPNGVNPDKWKEVDLQMAHAIDELIVDTMLPAMNLGNWSARPGAAS